MAEKRAPHLLMTEEKNTMFLRDKRISWTSIRSYLSDAGVSVSSKTIKSRLADLLNAHPPTKYNAVASGHRSRDLGQTFLEKRNAVTQKCYHSWKYPKNLESPRVSSPGFGNGVRCYSTGRLRVTTPNEDRYLAVTAKRNRRSTSSDLSRQLSSATGTRVSQGRPYTDA
ncbi:transposable element Tcb2 transposase [Trichonephila clavipes]|nr:transposable element Tcb2 transposase [Trichonephila clavipes]